MRSLHRNARALPKDPPNWHGPGAPGRGAVRIARSALRGLRARAPAVGRAPPVRLVEGAGHLVHDEAPGDRELATSAPEAGKARAPRRAGYHSASP